MREARTTRQAYTEFVFRLLLAGSAASLAALLKPAGAARFARAFGKFSSRELAQFRRTLRRLEKQRLIEVVEQGETAIVRLTPDGAIKARQVTLRELDIPRPSAWDGKWRLVIFDIPEYLRIGRDTLRTVLTRIGFYQVQKSVFIFPFPCEREIEAVAKTLHLEKYIHCFVSKIQKKSYRNHLAKHFRL